MHGDLPFVGAESVIREITRRAGDLDVVVLDVRGTDETAAISVTLLTDLRDQFRAEGGEAVIVDPGRSVLGLAAAPDAPSDTESATDLRVRYFLDGNSAIDYAEDAIIARRGGPAALARSVAAQDHPLLAGLSEPHVAVLRSALISRSYAEGELLARAGTVGHPAHGLFLVLSGTVDVGVTQPRVGRHARRGHHVRRRLRRRRTRL